MAGLAVVSDSTKVSIKATIKVLTKASIKEHIIKEDSILEGSINSMEEELLLKVADCAVDQEDILRTAVLGAKGLVLF